MTRHGGSHGQEMVGVNNMQMHTLLIADRKVGVHFNGDYFLDDDNNVFLQRHHTTRNWFVMVRDGYVNQKEVVEANARIERAMASHTYHDYGFGAGWQEYLIMVEMVLRR